MKYRLKDSPWGLFEKCEELSTPNGLDIYTPGGNPDFYPQFLQHQVKHAELFEPVEDRIRVRFGEADGTPWRNQKYIQKVNGETISEDELELMEQAINGELVPKGKEVEILWQGKPLTEHQKELISAVLKNELLFTKKEMKDFNFWFMHDNFDFEDSLNDWIKENKPGPNG